MTALDAVKLIAAAEHWERLADESERLAVWERERGIDMSQPGCSVGDHQARLYRATARALRLEAESGVPHCSTCFGDHPPENIGSACTRKPRRADARKDGDR